MIKIILPNGTQIELDKYEKGIFDDIKALSRAETISVQAFSKKLCKVCKNPIPKRRHSLCGNENCLQKRNRINQRTWWRKHRSKSAMVSAQIPESVPLHVA